MNSAAVLLLGGLCASGASAALTPRYGQAAALLTNGKVLVVGGISDTGVVLNTGEILDTTNGSEFVSPQAVRAAGNMAVARSSATITVLPNGSVLVTGGWTGAAARSDAEIYDPTTNGWTTVSGMSTGRFNHTATLLNTGNVLVCGGQTGAAAAVTATCDLFTPSGSPGSYSGSFAPAASMFQARALQTATLLNDGTVWIAGGWNPSATPTYLVTTERYNPGTGLWQQGQPLGVARAYHSATLTGDNKVLVAGGYNGKNFMDANGYGTLGFLSSTELFDPTGGSIVPGPPMQARVQNHGGTLRGVGDVSVFGGYANIPSSLLSGFVPGISGIVSGSGGTLTAGALTATAPLSFYLDTPVTGNIVDGDVQFRDDLPTTPVETSVSDSGVTATVDFTAADPTNTAIGLRNNLAGAAASCDTQGRCGFVSGALPFSNAGQGTYVVSGLPMNVNIALLSNQPASGSIFFTPSPINSAQNGSITGGSFSAHVRFGVPSWVPVGGSIQNVQVTATDGGWSEISSYTVVLTGGSSALLPGPFTVQLGGSGVHYIDIPSLTISGITGTITVTASTTTYKLFSGFAFPLGGAGNAPLSAFDGTMTFDPMNIDLSGATLKSAKQYAVVRNMISGDNEYYTPSLNQWGFVPPSDPIKQQAGAPRVGASSILLPGDDEIDIGGKNCKSGTSCGTIEAAETGGVRSDWGWIWEETRFSAGQQADPLAHAFHTATLLSDGTILVAGGTDGSYVLPFAETFDPATQSFTAARSYMQFPRQQHTANLLTNGRVLLAGGFTTTATSTGPTNSAEIYYPDTRVFLPAAVMISSHSQHVAITLPNGNVFVAGGYIGSNTTTKSAEIYSSTKNAWVPAAPMNTDRAISAAVQAPDGRIFLFGGTNGSGNLSSVEAYDPATNSWAAPGAYDDMPSALQGHTATLLTNGTVLISGGDDGFGETSSSFLFNPKAPPGSQWIDQTGTRPMTTGRYGHTATLMPNGTVLVTGGVQIANLGGSSTANALKGVDRYHPDFASWWDGGGGNLFAGGARTYHTATLANDGYVYVFGGTNGSIGSSQSTLFYTTYERAYFTGAPDSSSRIQPSLRQSSITTTTTSPFLPGSTFNATGLRFRGATEATAGGGGPANTSFSHPRLLLQKMDGMGGSGSDSSPGFIVDLTTQVYLNPANQSTLDTSLTVPLPGTPGNPAALPFGWYQTWIGDNEIHSLQALPVQVGPAKPTTAPVLNSPTVMGTSSISWTWSAVAGVDGYDVYSATTGVFIGTTSAVSTTFIQTGLQPNATAAITVAGYTLSGDGPSGASQTAYTLSTAPINVQIASVTFNALLLEWAFNGNSTATVYEVTESTDWPSPFSTSLSTPVPALLGTTTDQVVISNLAPNTTYTFRLQAYNSVGIPSSGYSAYVSTLTRASVSQPIGNAINSTSIHWSWTGTGTGITYRIYNSTSGQVIFSTTTPSFDDAGLGVNTSRSIMVSGVTSAGESPLSPAATAYTLCNAPVLQPFLQPPTTFSVQLGWSANGNPNGTIYHVVILEHRDTGIKQSTFNLTGFSLDTALTGPSLQPSDEVDAFVSAFNGAGVETSPLEISTYTKAAQPLFNAFPTFPEVTPTSIALQWGTGTPVANSSATIYQVTYSSSDPTLQVNLSTAVDFPAQFHGSSITVTGLLTATTYWFQVLAMNPLGRPSDMSPSTFTLTTNGGATAGSLAGVLTALGPSQVAGNIANGQFILLQSGGSAFPSDTTVTISSYSILGHGPLCPNGLDLAISITDNPSYQPDKPIYLTASYPPALLGVVPASRFALARFDPLSGTCVPLETAFDETRQEFTARLNHFSLYQLVQIALATDAGTARVFPNPWRASTDGYVTIDRVPPASRVRIFTLRGETVLDQPANGAGLLTWSGTNSFGRPIASGLYLIVVETGSSKKILKLAVVR